MKVLINFIAVAMLTTLACTPSTNDNEAAQDTASVIGNSGLNAYPDSNSLPGNQVADSSKNSNSQYQESNNNQAPRTSVGSDTTGNE